MIHLGAGWGALRAFLLVSMRMFIMLTQLMSCNEQMLVATRFITVGEVVRVLKHYETHTGMDYWYKDKLDELPDTP